MIQPEAVYAATNGGDRTTYVVFDLHDPSRMPIVAEPLFMQAGAEVDVTPVMNQADLESRLRESAGGSA